MSRAALLMIDFQRDFCAPGGYADRCGGIAWVQPILPVARRLLEAARRTQVLIIHTREGYAPDLRDCHPHKLGRSRRAGGEVGAPGPMGRLLIRGEYGHDIVDELQPLPEELVVDKATYGAFCHSKLEDQLRAHDVSNVAICGVTADVCVHTTLREATDRGFICQYVSDAISTFDPTLRAACERMVEQEGGIWGTLTNATKVIENWATIPTDSPALSDRHVRDSAARV